MGYEKPDRDADRDAPRYYAVVEWPAEKPGTAPFAKQGPWCDSSRDASEWAAECIEYDLPATVAVENVEVVIYEVTKRGRVALRSDDGPAVSGAAALNRITQGLVDEYETF